MASRVACVVWLVVVGTAVFARPVSAQTIRPLVAEYQRDARGRFELVNDSDRPLNVVMELRGFSVGEDGEIRDETLPEGIHVKLSATSMRLPPRQTRMVFYEARADRMPSWFVIYAMFSGYPARDFSGINVQLELPHIVYVLPKESLKKGDVRIADASLQTKGTLSIVVENIGSNFGRIASLRIDGANRHADAPGFPLFPGGRRRIEVPWDDSTLPGSIEVKTREFSVVQTVAPPPP